MAAWLWVFAFCSKMKLEMRGYYTVGMCVEKCCDLNNTFLTLSFNTTVTANLCMCIYTLKQAPDIESLGKAALCDPPIVYQFPFILQAPNIIIYQSGNALIHIHYDNGAYGL